MIPPFFLVILLVILLIVVVGQAHKYCIQFVAIEVHYLFKKLHTVRIWRTLPKYPIPVASSITTRLDSGFFYFLVIFLVILLRYHIIKMFRELVTISISYRFDIALIRFLKNIAIVFPAAQICGNDIGDA